MNFGSDLDGNEDLEVASQVSESPEATAEVVAGLKQLARSCEEHLRTLLRNEEERDDAYESKEGHWVSHHFSEFNLWCTKVGIHGEGFRSLEVRLKDAPELCNLLRAHLRSLKQDLEDLQQPIAIHAQALDKETIAQQHPRNANCPWEPSLSQEFSYNDKTLQNIHREGAFQVPMPDNTGEDDEPSFKPDQPPPPHLLDQKTIYTVTEDTKLDMSRPKSEPKRAESVASITLRPELPPPPNFSGTTFQCPYCRLEFRAAEAEKNPWAEHVIHDFEPYFCIFEDCEAPFDVLNHFDGLLNHLHTHLEEYYYLDIPDGKHEELDEAEFEEYVMRQGKILSETLALLKETNRRKGPFLFRSCPFCGGYPDNIEKLFPERDTVDAQKALRHHIRSHMRDISLFLPPYRDDIFDQRDGDEISHRASQSAGHSIPRNPESFLLTCEREDCDCKTSGKRGDDVAGNSSVDKAPVLETPLSVPQTDEGFWSKTLADFPRYNRTSATNDDYLEDDRLGPFIEQLQSSSQPYLDLTSIEGNELEWRRLDRKVSISSLVVERSEDGEYNENTMQRPVSLNLESFGDNSDLDSETVQNKLLGGLIGSRFDRLGFIPRGHVERVVNEQAVMHELKLKDCLHPDAREGGIQHRANEIIKRYKKIFAILLLVQEAGSIVDFLKDGISDNDLPFRRRESHIPIQSWGLYPREGNLPLNAFEKWSTAKRQEFLEWQWVILAPFFSRKKDGKPMISMLPDEAHLPFVRTVDVDNFGGGFGSISRIFIHPDHHDLKDPGNRPFAIKLSLAKYEDLKAEFDVLDQIQNRHLMSVLGGFCQRSDNYLIFDWPDSDLSKYWMTHESPDFNYDTVLWVAEQCAGLSSGLHQLHRGNGMQELRELISSRSKLGPRNYGIHGDIKPENILWINDGTKGGTLKIVDLSLAKFSAKDKRSDWTRTGSPFYQSPEVKLGGVMISRSSDMWSMGCLYLEFIAWLLGGWRGFRGYTS
ncbi:Protein kinase domain-containing protein [Fusarium sp. LHS14.1]|nr:Protein kinase domain-containing protein [Fusarium sp. LHS14.1]